MRKAFPSGLPVVKGAELTLRMAYTLLPLFLLDDVMAGKFGLMVTAVTLFSFVILFERHIDFQRSYVGKGNESLDSGVVSSLPLFLLNIIVAIPIFVISINLLTSEGLSLISCLLLVGAIEAFFNFAYLIAVVDRRYEGIVLLSVQKNAFILCSFLALNAVDSLSLKNIWFTWAISCLAFIVVGILRLRSVLEIKSCKLREKITPIGWLYKRSYRHFLIGLIAVLLLQIDRIIVATLLEMAEVGVYYRHVALVAVAYQVFNVVVFNRWVAKIYREVNVGRYQEASLTLDKIYIRVAMITAFACPVIYTAFIVINSVGLNLGLRLDLATLLIAAAIIRFRADFNNMLLNAMKAEGKILQNQIISFLFLILSMPVFIIFIGPIGAAIGNIAVACLYCGLSFRSRRTVGAKSLMST